MFTKRHEQELAEIKALTHELGERFQQILDELEQIKEAQARSATRDRQGGAGKRKAGRARAKPLADEAPEAQATVVKKPRSRGTPAAVAPVAAVTGKRQDEATGKRAARPKQAKRRRAAEARAEDAAVADPEPVMEARPIKRGANNSRRG